METLTITIIAPDGRVTPVQCGPDVTVTRAIQIAKDAAAKLRRHSEVSRNGQWLYRFQPQPGIYTTAKCFRNPADFIF